MGARNNNGRSFTVTKAYENKVSDLRTMARVSAGGQTADYSVHAVYGDVTDSVSSVTCASSGTPGIYYDVSIGATASPNAGEVGPTATIEISCAAGSADCSNTVVSSVIITGYNALVTPAATYDLGAVLNTAAYGSCTGAKTISLTTAEHALAASVHTNTRKNQKNAFATTGTAPACAAVGPAGAHVNMVVPYLPFTNLGSGTDLNAVGALAHVKCEAGAFAVVANAAPGLFASKDADNRLNIQPAAATIITG